MSAPNTQKHAVIVLRIAVMLSIATATLLTCNLISQDIVDVGGKHTTFMVKQCVFKCQDKSLVYQDTGRYEQCPKILYHEGGVPEKDS